MSTLVNDKKWEDFEVFDDIRKTLNECHFDRPSITQQKLLEKLKENPNDCGILEAPPGTGKTLAFLLAIIKKIDPTLKETQAVILCHTQILAVQIVEEAKKLFKTLGITQTLCLGLSAGYKFEPNQHLVVGTQQAFYSNFSAKIGRGTKQAAINSPFNIRIMVIDEADHFYQSSNDR